MAASKTLSTTSKPSTSGRQAAQQCKATATPSCHAAGTVPPFKAGGKLLLLLLLLAALLLPLLHES